MAKRNKKIADEYCEYIEHPRYGRTPRITGLNPKLHEDDGDAWVHFRARPNALIPNTAIAADQTRQDHRSWDCIQFYFDVRCKCRDCGKMFIFFAQEQKFWFEELRFIKPAWCVRCHPCRIKQRGIERKRALYDQLAQTIDPSPIVSLELAELALALLQRRQFSTYGRIEQRIRMWLERASRDTELLEKCGRLRSRASAVANENLKASRKTQNR